MQKLASSKKKLTKTIIVTLIFLLAPLTAFASASPTYMGGIEDVCDLSLTDSQGDIYDSQDIEDFGQRIYGQLTRIIVEPETYTMDIDCVANLDSGTIELTVFKVVDQDGISPYNSATDRIPTQASTFFVSSAASTLTLDATGALANRLLVNWELDAESINGDPVQQSGMLIVIPLNDTKNDTTPRISFWSGKVNQHNENGVWMTDSDGVSGGGTHAQWGAEGYGDRKLEYCQKFWPNTISVELRTFNEEITFRNRGNSGSYDSIRDVYECVLEDDLGDDDAGMGCVSSILPIDGLVNITDVNSVYNIGDQFDGYFDTCWIPSNNSMSLIAWLNNSNGMNYDIQGWGGGNNWASMNLGVQQLGPYGHWGFPISEDGSTFGMNYSSLSLPLGDYCWEALLKVYDGNTYTPVDDDTACFTIQSNITGGNKTGDDDNNTGEDNNTGGDNDVCTANIELTRSDTHTTDYVVYPITWEIYGFTGDGVLTNSDYQSGVFVKNVSYNGEDVFTLDVTDFVNTLITSEDQYVGFVFRQPGVALAYGGNYHSIDFGGDSTLEISDGNTEDAILSDVHGWVQGHGGDNVGLGHNGNLFMMNYGNARGVVEYNILGLAQKDCNGDDNTGEDDDTGDDDNNTGGDNDTGDEDEQPYIPPTLDAELDTTTSPSILSLTASNLDSSKDYTIEWWIVSTATFDIVSGSEGIENSTGLQITDTWLVTDEIELESGEYCLLGTLFEDGELVETEVMDCQTVVTPEVVEDVEVEANMVEKIVTAISEFISGLLASIVESKDE